MLDVVILQNGMSPLAKTTKEKRELKEGENKGNGREKGKERKAEENKKNDRRRKQKERIKGTKKEEENAYCYTGNEGKLNNVK